MEQMKTRRKGLVREFKYVDAMPGSGKTELFVRTAASLLSERTPTTNLVYVAPTIRLLVEAYLRVLRHPLYPKGTHRRIHLVASPGIVYSTLENNLHPTLHKGSPAVTLNELLGLVDPSEGVPSVDPIEPGSIILTTHESFVRVNYEDLSGNNFAILRRTDVIFDEARHCILESRVLRDVSNEALTNIAKSFRLDLINPPTTVPKEKASSWCVYSITEAPTRERLRETFGVKNWGSIPKAVRELRSAVAACDSGRAGVYVLSGARIKTVSASPNKDAVVSLFTVLRPTGLFDHYRDVILTSAFFKDSQMYHFLKMDGNTFVDLKGSGDPKLRRVYARDAKLRSNLSDRLRVGVLLTDGNAKHQRKEYRNLLTSSLLENGMVCPLKLQLHAKEFVSKDLASSKVISRAYYKASVSRSAAFNRTIQKYAQPPLWVLLKESLRILEEQTELGTISRPSGPSDHDNLTLLVINVANKVWGWKSDRIPYSYVVRKLYADGQIHNRVSTSAFDDVYTKEAQQAMDTTPPDTAEFLADALYVGSPNRRFVIPSSNRLHGINLYKSVRSFVHLAALNPTPQLISFYRAVLGGEYDVDQDHSIENLVQMLYRTNLRDPKASDPVVMIVPYATQAHLLRSKVGCGPFIFINEPRLTRWEFRQEVEPTQRQVIASVAGSASARVRASPFAPEDKAKVNAARCSISRYRTRLRENPEHPNSKKWEAKIAVFQQRLLALRIK